MTDFPPPLIAVVDDDDSVRDSISLLLTTLGMEVRSYRDCQGLLRELERLRLDCLILDVRLPGISGLEFQAASQERLIDLPIIFISGHGDIPMAVRAMRQGALDFLQKPFAEQALIDRVNQAIALSTERRTRKVAEAAVRARLALLTQREGDVLNGLVAGLTSKAIADDLRISSRTVEQHRARIMEKMRCTSIAELVQALMRIGYPPPP